MSKRHTKSQQQINRNHSNSNSLRRSDRKTKSLDYLSKKPTLEDLALACEMSNKL